MRGSASHGVSCDDSLVPEASNLLAGNELAVTHPLRFQLSSECKAGRVVQTGTIILLSFFSLAASYRRMSDLTCFPFPFVLFLGIHAPCDASSSSVHRAVRRELTSELCCTRTITRENQRNVTGLHPAVDTQETRVRRCVM